MQPTNTYGQPPIWRRYLKPVTAFIVVLLLLCAVSLIYRNLTFHIVRIDPKTSYFADTSAFMDIYFNKPLDSAGLQVSGVPQFIASSSVSGKRLRLKISTNGLKAGTRYTVTLQHVASSGGKVISGKTISFTPQNIDFNKTSPAQQKASIDQQDNYPYMVTTVPFNGFDTLAANGLSSDQEQAVEQYIFDYSNYIKAKFTAVTIDTASVAQQPYNPDTDDSMVTNFNFTANGVAYSASASYSGLDDVSLVIRNPSGAVWDSNIDDQPPVVDD